MSSDPDYLHIQKVLSGDKDSFRYFVKTYQEMAFSIALSIVKDKDVANDVVQNAFVRLYKRLRTFRMESKFSSWFYRIVVNEALKHLKKFNYLRNTESIPPESNLGLRVMNEVQIKLDSEDNGKFIDAVFAKMKPKETLILQLFYLHDNSIAEIQEITGFSTANIKILLHRGRKNFLYLFKNLKI